VSAPTLLKLGAFVFSMDTAAFEEFQRVTEYLWPAQDRIGTTPALQFLGMAVETISLRGSIYPHFRGGLGQIDGMRAQAGLGTPLLLVDALGSVKGFWCITRVLEGRKSYWPSGAPKQMDFELECHYYGPNGTDTQPASYPVVGATVGGDSPMTFVRAPSPAADGAGSIATNPAGAPYTPGRIGAGGVGLTIDAGPLEISVGL
jgi:hypothetical protein